MKVELDNYNQADDKEIPDNEILSDEIKYNPVLELMINHNIDFFNANRIVLISQRENGEITSEEYRKQIQILQDDNAPWNQSSDKLSDEYSLFDDCSLSGLSW